MRIFLIVFICVFSTQLTAQEKDISGFEINLDQDYFADFLREGNNVDNNYTIAMRLGIYGELADHDYLGLPWVRRRVDEFLLDNLIYKIRFNEDKASHNFVFITNGFSPSFINDEDEDFELATTLGYSLAEDRPFSSFTGFRSTRRLEGTKRFVHSARLVNLAFNSSFTFGFASLGIIKGTENMLGARRPEAVLWDKDENETYPTGQLILSPMPLFMYSISAEAVVWQPLKKVLLQLRPEVNLGYYTDIGIGLDFGKVMNVEPLIDNLSYTDTNNPGLVVVNNESVGLSIVAGGTVRARLYNAHLNGWYGASRGEHVSFSETKKLMWEGYVGAKVQLLQKVEISFSLTRRSAEFDRLAMKRPFWGTIGLKYLMAPPGEGCYD